MKKFNIIFTFILLLCSLTMVACENATMVKSATINEITSSGSKNYGVRVSFQKDSRLDGKGVDVQIKFSKLGEIVIWKENQDKITFEIEEIDEWYSLTNIFAMANGNADKEKFTKYEDALTQTYLFNYDGNNEITLRAVVGTIEENHEKTGEILVGSEPISDQFVLKIK